MPKNFIARSILSLLPKSFLKWNRFIIIFILLIPLCFSSRILVRSVSSSSSVYYVTGDSVNLRLTPSTNAPVTTLLYLGQAITLLATDGSWYQVMLDDQMTGWVHANYVASSPPSPSAASTTESSSITTLLNYAQSLLNCRYRFGGSSAQGFDCSGFTMHVFAKIGFSLPHKALTQYSLGVKIEKDNLDKGDLVFFKTLNSPIINHVGIYIGDGKFIHASSGAGFVVINSLTSGYYFNCYQSARRLFKIS